MPEIGQTLREARMRARIDISELEAETKIRAKYLRALENEEWNLLPGPTYVKSFLRTYAEALGLDGRLLLEEYKLRHERLSEHELQPISPRTARDARRRPPPRRGPPRGTMVALVFVVLIGALYVIGRNADDEEPVPPPSTQTARERPSTTERDEAAQRRAERRRRRQAAARRRVRLTISATGPVYVCLRAGEKVLIDRETLAAGQQRGPYRAKRFTMTFGNNNVRMRVNGRNVAVPASAGAIGYAIDRRGRRPLPDGQRPSCGG